MKRKKRHQNELTKIQNYYKKFLFQYSNKRNFFDTYMCIDGINSTLFRTYLCDISFCNKQKYLLRENLLPTYFTLHQFFMHARRLDCFVDLFLHRSLLCGFLAICNILTVSLRLKKRKTM